jgi:hypothetical protein
VRLLAGGDEDGEEQCGEDANDGDHHQQFDQSEAASSIRRHTRTLAVVARF